MDIFPGVGGGWAARGPPRAVYSESLLIPLRGRAKPGDKAPHANRPRGQGILHAVSVKMAFPPGSEQRRPPGAVQGQHRPRVLVPDGAGDGAQRPGRSGRAPSRAGPGSSALTDSGAWREAEGGCAPPLVRNRVSHRLAGKRISSFVGRVDCGFSDSAFCSGTRAPWPPASGDLLACWKSLLPCSLETNTGNRRNSSHLVEGTHQQAEGETGAGLAAAAKRGAGGNTHRTRADTRQPTREALFCFVSKTF